MRVTKRVGIPEQKSAQEVRTQDKYTMISVKRQSCMRQGAFPFGGDSTFLEARLCVASLIVLDRCPNVHNRFYRSFQEGVPRKRNAPLRQ